MKIHLIFARAANGVIGRDNALPWHLPEDMAHFRRLTQGCPVIMGRRTWDSLPVRFRPLPQRLNIVITRQHDWHCDGALRAASLAQAIGLCPPDSTIWIIGGAQIYAEALALADEAHVTEIHAEFAGDAFAPQFGPAWHETARESHVSSTGLAFSFVTYSHSKGV